jgi:endonuclease/exonuclease/phosphatase family metal-dependent hydrolase
MRILTLNTWLVPWAKDNKQRRRKILDFILEKDYDVINLQEVWVFLDKYYFISRMKDYGYVSSETYFVNKTGLLTFHKGRLLKSGVRYFKDNEYNSVRERFAKKGSLYLKIKLRGETYNIINTHLMDCSITGSQDVNKENFKKLMGFIKDKKKVIMTGDFNLFSRHMKKLRTLKFTNKEKTFLKSKNKYAEDFNDKLDYVFYKGLNLKKSEVIKHGLSDHYGISVDFKE